MSHTLVQTQIAYWLFNVQPQHNSAGYKHAQEKKRRLLRTIRNAELKTYRHGEERAPYSPASRVSK